MARVKATETPGGASVIDEAAPDTLQTSANGQGDVRMIALADLCESPLNPRKHFDAAKLAELAESVRQKGVLVPALVRAVKAGGYEIVAGARRFRAAGVAGLQEMRCIVCELTDIEALEVAVVENGQREDVTPLEEAEGYAALMKKAKYDVATIAGKVGKSASHVYQRLKLAELIAPAKEQLDAGLLTPGHAILIARLEAKDQKRALDNCIEKSYRGQESVMSVRSLNGWIEENVHIDLSKAPWKLDDADLLPGAGACASCKFNTACNTDLYADLEGKARCLQGSCFQKKLTKFTAGLRKEVEATGEKLVELSCNWVSSTEKGKLLGESAWQPAKKDCKSPVKGVIRSEGRKDSKDYQIGEVLDVCTNNKCKVCWPQNPYSQYRAPKPTAKELEKRKKEKADHEIQQDVDRRIAKAIVSKTKTLKARELRIICSALIGYIPDELACYAVGVEHGKELKVEQLSEADLIKWCLAMAIGERLYDNPMVSRAKEFGVDVGAIRKQVKADMAGMAVEKEAPVEPAEVAKVMKAEKRKLEKKTKGKGKKK